jgi:hypothetical protein
MVADRMARWWRGLGLVEIVVVVAVLLILAAVLLPRYVGGQAPERKALSVRAPMTLVRESVCASNLRMVRQSLELRRGADLEGAGVGSLVELRELPSESCRCPVGGEEYLYDPRTGRVQCPHPGHENF